MSNQRRPTFRRRLVVSHVVAVTGVLATGFVVQAQQTAEPVSITWFMPVERAADLLQEGYGRPVTYEDPMRVWRGELEVAGRGKSGREYLRVKQHTLVIPQGVLAGDSSALSVALLTKLLDAYHQQNPDQARFRVLESPMGFHIVPSQVHDEAGRLGRQSVHRVPPSGAAKPVAETRFKGRADGT